MDESNAVVPPQYAEVLKENTNIEKRAKQLAMAIKDDESYRAACEYRVVIATNRKNWAMTIKPAVTAAHDAHKKIKKVENDVDIPLGKALESLDPAISKWRYDQETARRLEQEKINKQLRKEEEDRQLAEAQALHDSGQKDAAEAVIQAPVMAPEVVLPPTTKVDGIQDRTYWSAQVFDIVKLCKAIGEGKVPPSAVAANMVLFNGLARSMKSAMNAEWESKGVRAVSRTDIVGG